METTEHNDQMQFSGHTLILHDVRNRPWSALLKNIENYATYTPHFPTEFKSWATLHSINSFYNCTIVLSTGDAEERYSA